MKVLIIGGTGLISQGIVKHLLGRGAEVTVLNRAKRENPFGGRVKSLVGDRTDYPAFEAEMAGHRFDVVIDMIGFTPAQAESDVRAFGGRCEQFIFCSTVCTYGIKIPPAVLVDETFAQEPISEYGRNKVACEKIVMAAQGERKFKATVVRPSHTYGPSAPMIDQLEGNAVAWDRVEKGMAVVCTGDGLGLWQSTHRDDVGRLFAHACLNSRTYGESYNATRDEVFTWRDYYRQMGEAMGRPVKLVMMPADWVVARDPKRFGLLREITRYHGAYSSAKAKRDVPEFAGPNVGFVEGARETLADVKRRGAWRRSEEETAYQAMVDDAARAGIGAVEA